MSTDQQVKLIKMFMNIIVKVCYEGAITYICCDETNSFPLWSLEMWKSLVKRMDCYFVPGRHLQMRDETRGKIIGSIMMTTAAMKYQSAFSIFNLQAVRSRSQERLVESLKQGFNIWMLSTPSKKNMVIILKQCRLLRDSCT